MWRKMGAKFCRGLCCLRMGPAPTTRGSPYLMSDSPIITPYGGEQELESFQGNHHPNQEFYEFHEPQNPTPQHLQTYSISNAETSINHPETSNNSNNPAVNLVVDTDFDDDGIEDMFDQHITLQRGLKIKNKKTK